MLDRYWHGSADRISPEAPVPVVNIIHDEVRPGGAANVALNLASLGVAVSCFGLVGTDSDAEILEQMLTNHKVSTNFKRVNQRTITKLRVMSKAHQMIRLDFEVPFHSEDAEQLANSVSVNDQTAIVLSDYAKGSVAAQSLIQAAKARSIPIIVDPKGSNFEKYRGATVLTPNRSELRAVMGDWNNDDELIVLARRLVVNLDLDALLVTRSEQGMTLISANDVFHFAATNRDVADVTGAGDTVIATVAAGLGSGLSIVESANLANLAAGIAVAKLGTATVSCRELEQSLSKKSGIFETLQEAVSWVEECRQLGEKVVMTNGCFDILHAGHVSYLKEAASLGDRLLIAVNSDASVSKLKGPERPLNSIERRLQVLASLEAVDAVICFEDETPVLLIDQIRPDILVKGGDYKSIKEVVGFERVLAYGGDVRVLGEVTNLSTKNLITKIRQQSPDSTN